MNDVRRRTLRVAVTTAAAGLLLAGAATTTAAVPAGAPTAPTAVAAVAAAESGDVSVFGGLEVKVVEPYEPLGISDEWWMGLLPQGEQNFVVSPPEKFGEDVEAAKGYPGSSIRPDSISLGVHSENDEVRLITGAWRLPDTPREIIVTFEGDDFGYAAQIVRLPGEPGWGTYYFDAAGWGLSERAFTVRAVGQDGEVFDALTYRPMP